MKIYLYKNKYYGKYTDDIEFCPRNPFVLLPGINEQWNDASLISFLIELSADFESTSAISLNSKDFSFYFLIYRKGTPIWPDQKSGGGLSIPVNECQHTYKIQINNDLTAIKVLCFEKINHKCVQSDEGMHKYIHFIRSEDIPQRIDDVHSPFHQFGIFVNDHRYKTNIHCPLLDIMYKSFRNYRVQNLESFLNSMPGRYRIVYGEKVKVDPHGYGYSPDGEKTLKYLLWVAPDAAKYIALARCYCIDASFYASKPYVYSIFIGEFCGVSYPFALSVGIKEDEQLFENMFMFLNELGIPMKNAPIISDMGKGIEAFCDKFGFHQIWCIKHFIESVGPTTYSGQVFRGLIKTYSPDEFVSLLATSIEYIRQYEIVKSNNMDESIRKEIQHFMECMPSVNPKYDPCKWALGLRAPYGYPSTTNFSESLHGRINQLLPNHCSFVRGISTIIKVIISHLQNSKDLARRALNRALQKIEKNQRKPSMIYYYSNVFGIRLDNYIGLPPKHKAWNVLFQNLVIINYSENDSTVSQLSQIMYDDKDNKEYSFDRRQIPKEKNHNAESENQFIQCDSSVQSECSHFVNEFSNINPGVLRELLSIINYVTRCAKLNYVEVHTSMLLDAFRIDPDLFKFYDPPDAFERLARIRYLLYNNYVENK